MAHLFTHVKSIRGSVPLFLCPSLAKCDAAIVTRRSRRQVSVRSSYRCNLHTDSAKPVTSPPPQLLNLPRSCPGCGAYTQTIKLDEPGFYSIQRKSIKNYSNPHGRVAVAPGQDEADAFSKVLENADRSVLAQLGLDGPETDLGGLEGGGPPALSVETDGISTPVCDRCHHLIHHQAGVSVSHPTLQSIRDIISESPHRNNHIYHVLDAADFPLSLVPTLQRSLSLSPLRSINRRAKTTTFQHGRIAELSYIITRSDLLAPKKEQVDRLMPYIVDVLREALGGTARNVRLGNVHCVSSKRGWWTNSVKEEIFDRGGGGWMVGKVNVGKSNLFEHVYPKGRTQTVDFDSLRGKAGAGTQFNPIFDTRSFKDKPNAKKETLSEAPEEAREDMMIDESPLPPIPREIPFPTLPLVSALPGTTASPIRLSFGNGKGELVDLPGLDRGDLGAFVVENHRPDLVMRERIKAKQLTIKPGQSLLVGGLIQIRPTTPDVTLLAYPFVPLPCHVSSAEKVQSLIMGDLESGVPTIARPGIGTRMQSAGTFPLKWDVTKERSGPLTAKAAADLSTKFLPFVVLSTDILIEGCGWIELVAQVRKKDFEQSELAQTKTFFDDKAYPMVEIVSPDGKHVGYRRPIGAWLLGGEKPDSARASTARPRRSMKGAKKSMKKLVHAHNV